MNIYRGHINDVHSCNGCKRGKLKSDKFGMEYPYEYVTVIEGTSISIRLCDDCLNEVKNFSPTT